MINRLRVWEAKFSLPKAAFIVGFFALTSRFTGLIRDRMLAGRFGAGDTLDSYYAAFRLPDFIFNLLILGTLSAAFVPVFTEWLYKDKKHANKIANTVLNFSFLSMSVICVILFFNVEWLTKLMVPGFSGQKFADTVNLTRIFLLSPVIFTLSNFFSSLLNANKRFLVSSFAPILYNGGIIVGILFLYPRYGLFGLGFGVILGALLHLTAQILESLSTGYFWQPNFDTADPAVKKIGALFFPRIFGIDTSQLSLLIGSIVGSYLSSGSIAILNLANNLQAVPTGIFGVSTALASFPVLSEDYAKKDTIGFAENFYQSLMQILYFVLPISILIFVFRAHIVRVVYGSGEFNWEDTILTFQTLGVFAFGLFSQATMPLLSRTFYARQNTKIPVVVGVACMALNIFLSWLLAPSLGVVGIAAAFSSVSIINALILFFILRQKLIKNFNVEKLGWNFDSRLSGFIIKLILSSMAAGSAGYLMLNLIEPILNTKTGFGILMQTGVSAVAAILIFGIISHYLQIEHTKKTINFIFKYLKIWSL